MNTKSDRSNYRFEKTSIKGITLNQKIGFELIVLLFFYLMIVVFFSVISDNFLSTSNAVNILDNISVLGIVAIGQVLVLIAGGFDLSVGGVVPLGATLFVILVNAGVNIFLAMLIVVIVGGIVGMINGFFITKLNINPLITTLGTLSITAGIAKIMTGGLTTILEDPSATILSKKIFMVPIHVIILVIISAIGYFVLKYTTYGRSLYALGGSKEASIIAGIRVHFMTISVYIICSALAAFGGIVLANQLMAGSGTMGSDLHLMSITAAVLGGASLLGGQGGVIGTLIGVLILGTLSNGMAIIQVQSFYQDVVTGIVLLIAINSNNIKNWLSRTRFLGGMSK